jgi:hypothetical protein
VHLAPVTPTSADGKAALRELEALVGLTDDDRKQGFHVAVITQVGDVDDTSLHLDDTTKNRLGAALMALRSERIQPGVNQEPSAPPPYQQRQHMDVPDALTEQCGRALYNAFAHFTGVSREEAKRLVMLERVDVLTPNGKERLRAIRKELEEIADLVVKGLPLWADLPTGKKLSSNTARGKKAFASTSAASRRAKSSRPASPSTTPSGPSAPPRRVRRWWPRSAARRTSPPAATSSPASA